MANLRFQMLRDHPAPINAIVVADDGVLYTASDDATVRVWHRNFCSEDRPHALTVTLPAKYSPVKTLTLNPDGGVLYGGCTDGYIHYWLKGWFSGQLQYGGPLQGHTHAVMCLTTAGNFVVSGSANSTSRCGLESKMVSTYVWQSCKVTGDQSGAWRRSRFGRWIMRVIRMVAQFALEVWMESLKSGVSGAPAAAPIDRDSNQIFELTL